jgi:hypothetical protein
MELDPQHGENMHIKKKLKRFREIKKKEWKKISKKTRDRK